MLYQGEQTETIDTEQELERLRRTVQTLREQLFRAQRLASVGTMAAMVVHEFNNILTPIVNYAQLARKRPEMVAKALTCTLSGGKRATDICGAILGMARRTTGEIQSFRLREVIDETLMAMARNPRRDGIDFVIKVPDALTLAVRQIEFQQVMLNLLLNARQAVLGKPTPRRIEVSARKVHRGVLLRVSDNGVGIPPGNLARIFEPFFTTHQGSADQSQGSGLGLAICREIIQSMNGQISVRSTEGTGTTFSLHLPQATA